MYCKVSACDTEFSNIGCSKPDQLLAYKYNVPEGSLHISHSHIILVYPHHCLPASSNFWRSLLTCANNLVVGPRQRFKLFELLIKCRQNIWWKRWIFTISERNESIQITTCTVKPLKTEPLKTEILWKPNKLFGPDFSILCSI